MPSQATSKQHRHPMRVVTRRTGLSADLLRAWERRYDVVTPARSEGGRRLYSDADIERLRLLYRATLAGRSIGQVADLPTEALAALVRRDVTADAEAGLGSPGAPARDRGALPAATDFLDDAFRAVARLECDGARRGPPARGSHAPRRGAPRCGCGAVARARWHRLAGRDTASRARAPRSGGTTPRAGTRR